MEINTFPYIFLPPFCQRLKVNATDLSKCLISLWLVVWVPSFFLSLAQSQRTVKVGRDLWSSSSPMFLLKAGLRFSYPVPCQGEASFSSEGDATISWQSPPVFSCTPEHFFWYSDGISPATSWSCWLLFCHCASPTSITASRYCKTVIRSPEVFFSLGWTNQIPPSL